MSLFDNINTKYNPQQEILRGIRHTKLLTFRPNTMQCRRPDRIVINMQK